MTIFETQNLYAKYLIQDNLDGLIDLYAHDGLETFDIINEFFDENNEIKLEEVKIWAKSLIDDVEKNRKIQNERYEEFAIFSKENDKLIGKLSFFNINNVTCAQEGDDLIAISYKIQSEHCGKGYASEIIKEFLNFVFNNIITPDDKIYALIDSKNEISKKIILKNNFIKICNVKFDDFCNIKIPRNYNSECIYELFSLDGNKFKILLED